jgi:acyl-coenzyme A thioesterase 13
MVRFQAIAETITSPIRTIRHPLLHVSPLYHARRDANALVMDQLRLRNIRDQIGQPGYASLSPTALWLCGTIVDAQPGKASIKFVVRREMTDEYGLLHMGILSSMASESLLMSVHTLDLDLEFHCEEINLELHDHAGLAQVITAIAEIDCSENEELTGSCRLHDEHQRLLGTLHCRLLAH